MIKNVSFWEFHYCPYHPTVGGDNKPALDQSAVSCLQRFEAGTSLIFSVVKRLSVITAVITNIEGQRLTTIVGVECRAIAWPHQAAGSTAAQNQHRIGNHLIPFLFEIVYFTPAAYFLDERVQMSVALVLQQGNEAEDSKVSAEQRGVRLESS